MAQHDEHPDIQNFLGWRQKNSVYAAHDPAATDEPRAFIPPTVVKEHFKTDGNARLKELLAVIFPDGSPVDPDDIFEHYLLIFCILVEIGKGRFIEFFSSWGHGDQRLPYDPDHPSQFPVDTADPNIYQKFCSKQWGYCAPDLRSSMTNTRYDANRILPIISKERIAGGGSAILYKIKVHGAFNKLGPQSTSPAKSPANNTFALKTYHTPDAKKYYENEVAAFRKLKLIPKSGLIGFYGSYIQADTFNVILEFADQGNLEEYFAKTKPPARPEEILNFWDGMFKTTGALKCLHDVEVDSGAKDGPQILHGFHQDIKPANILVTSGGIASPYKWEFKVADLGLSHFKKVVDGQRVFTANDAHGTRTYGAPECYRGDDFLEQANLKINPNVDIWSLGGVFSEAAIWVAHGYKGVLEYRISRKEETDRKPGFTDGDCFHDGEARLKVVKKWHKDIGPILRKCDNITASVISLIERDMLVAWGARATATQLWHRCQDIIVEAREPVPLLGSSASSSSDATPPRQPPELPPSSYPPPRPTSNRQTPTKPYHAQVSFSGSSNHYDARRDPSPDRLTMGDSEGTGRGDRADTSDSYPGRRSQRTDSDLAHEDRSHVRGSHGKLPHRPRQPYDQHPHSGYPQKRQSRISNASSESEAENQRYSSGPLGLSGLSGLSESYRQEQPYNEDNGEGPSMGRSRSKRNHEHSDTRRSLPKVHESSGDSFDDINGGASALRDSSSPEKPGRAVVVQHHHQHQHQPQPQQPTYTHQIPFLSVSEANDWKTQEKLQRKSFLHGIKSRFSPHVNALPHDYLRNELKERDHVFLIDDALSMAAHWKELIALVGLLSYIVKSADPDGLDMFYTISSKSVASKDSSDLVKSLQKTTPLGVSNLGMVLGNILGSYNVRLEKTLGSTAVRTQHSLRPLSLYVFTDGNWQPDSDAETPIKEVVRNLHAHRKLNKHQVGIQFVRFGDNIVGKRMLERLDDNLTMEKAGVKIDIVDTEPSNGNVWKMLLGAINPWFDRGDSTNQQPGSSSSSGYR